MDDSLERKRILYVITKANWGGAQRYVFDLAEAAKARGHDVAVAYGEPGALLTRLDAIGVRHAKVEGLARDLRLKDEVTALRDFLRLLKSATPDVLHVNSSKGGLALLAGRIARVRHILFTAHGFAFNEKRPWWQRLVLKAVYAVTILLAHTTICVSDAIRRDVRFFPDIFGKLVVVKSGIDSPTFVSRAEARKKFNLKSAETVLGMVAELHPSKRVEDALLALAELKGMFPGSLVVMGEGGERAYLESLIERLGLTGRAHLVGFVDHASSFLSAFDLFLMPSRTEALSYALIEAGFAGLPAIASRVGGIPEIVRNKVTGLLVPPENPASLARAIRMLLEDPALAKKLGENLKQHVETNFTKERMIDETLARY